MDRRAFIAGMVAALPSAAEAQRPRPMSRVGILALLSFSQMPDHWAAFRRGLHELGYREGQNIALEYRSAEGKHERLSELMAELLTLNVNIIVSQTTPGTAVAKKATAKIPIVMLSVADPIGAGFVSSLARPGANLTGFSLMSVDLGAKRLEFLKEVFPTASRVAVLWNPTNPAQTLMIQEAEVTARKLELTLVRVGIADATQVDNAFETTIKERARAIIVFEDSITVGNRRRIVELAAKHRLPAMYGTRLFIEEGGLIAFGPNEPEQYRRAAAYIDKILKGSDPSILPVEEPTKLDLVINLKTAKALGLTIRPSLLLRADQVIE